MDHVAERQAYGEPAGYKYPRFFFFGADVIEGAKRLAIRCQIAKRLVDHGLGLVSTQVMHRGLEGGLLSHRGYLDGEGAEHEWMDWMMELGQATGHALLKPRTEPPQIRESFPTVTGTRQQIFVPCLSHLIALYQFGSERTLPEWELAMETVQDGTFEAITLFETPIFYASTVMVDELIRMAGERPEGEMSLSQRQQEILLALLELRAFNEDFLQSTESVSKRASGVADPEAFKAPVAALVRAGFLSSKGGRAGGIWLTPAGHRRAEELNKR